MKQNKLKELVEWPKIHYANKMLDEGEPPSRVCKWINENGFKISAPTVYKYAQRRKEAIVTGVNVAFLTDRRKMKEAAKQIANDRKDMEIDEAKKYLKVVAEKVAKETPTRFDSEEDRKNIQKTFRKVTNEMEMLDEVIQKSFETLKEIDHLSPETGLKAIALKHKITGGSHKGFTVYGLEEIRLREAARESAITAVLLDYIPEEKHNEVIERMEEETRKYYESLGMKDEYEQMKALETIDDDEKAVSG